MDQERIRKALQDLVYLPSLKETSTNGIAPANGPSGLVIKEEGSGCRPWDRQDLNRRLQTYRASTWFCKPSKADAVSCARNGWVNTGADALSCECCGATLHFVLRPDLPHDQQQQAAQKFANRLQSGHNANCPWIGNSCDENLASYPPLPPQQVSTSYQERLADLKKLNNLPPISASAVDTICKTHRPQLSRLLSGQLASASDHVSTQQNSDLPDSNGTSAAELDSLTNDGVAGSPALEHRAKLIALCGWDMRLMPVPKAVQLLRWDSRKQLAANSHRAVLFCTTCGARSGLWSFSGKPTAALSPICSPTVGQLTVQTSGEAATMIASLSQSIAGGPLPTMSPVEKASPNAPTNRGFGNQNTAPVFRSLSRCLSKSASPEQAGFPLSALQGHDQDSYATAASSTASERKFKSDNLQIAPQSLPTKEGIAEEPTLPNFIAAASQEVRLRQQKVVAVVQPCKIPSEQAVPAAQQPVDVPTAVAQPVLQQIQTAAPPSAQLQGKQPALQQSTLARKLQSQQQSGSRQAGAGSVFGESAAPIFGAEGRLKGSAAIFGSSASHGTMSSTQAEENPGSSGNVNAAILEADINLAATLSAVPGRMQSSKFKGPFGSTEHRAPAFGKATVHRSQPTEHLHSAAAVQTQPPATDSTAQITAALQQPFNLSQIQQTADEAAKQVKQSPAAVPLRQDSSNPVVGSRKRAREDHDMSTERRPLKEQKRLPQEIPASAAAPNGQEREGGSIAAEALDQAEVRGRSSQRSLTPLGRVRSMGLGFSMPPQPAMTSFDPLKQHRPFCCWVLCKEDDEMWRCGWKWTLESLIPGEYAAGVEGSYKTSKRSFDPAARLRQVLGKVQIRRS